MQPWFTQRPGRALLSAVASLGMLTLSIGAVLAAPGVTPASVNLTRQPGDTFGPITKSVETPPIPPNPDIVFLVDTSTSMGPVIASVQANLPSILSNVLSAQPTAQFAVAMYKDMDDLDAGIQPFTVLQNLTANTGSVQSGINNLTPLSGGGTDAPEDYINALFQVGNGAINFRSNSTRVVLLIGDASSHDPSNGHTLGSAISALQGDNIRVIAIDVGPTPGQISDGLNAAGQAALLASATGGQLFSGINAGTVVATILAGLQNLPVTVTHTTSCDPNLSVSVTPASQSGTSGQTFTFTENGSVSASAGSPPTLSCTVKFLLNGSDGGPAFTQTINVAVQVPTTLTYNGATTGDYHDPATVSAVLTNSVTGAPIGSQNVTFVLNGVETCTGATNAAGVASCNITPNEPAGVYTLVATFAGSGNLLPSSDTTPFTVTREETVLVYTGDTTSDYHDAFTASAYLAEDGVLPIGGQTITFVLNGAETCTGTTDAGGNASCSMIPQEPAGTYTLTASFGGNAFYLPSGASTPFIVTHEETTTTYTGPTVIANGYATTLSGVLKEDGIVPIAGRTLTLTLGSGATAQACTGATDASGSASCVIASVNQPLGPGTATASFAGDAFYLPSSDTVATILFAFPTANGGTFVVGDQRATGVVNFWGSQWSKNNRLSGGAAPNAFKGFAGAPRSNPPTCGGTWSTAPGNSPPPPPPASIPSYMGVIVADSIASDGPVISGNILRIVIVQTDSGYSSNPGHAGTGTVVATLCQ